MAAYTALFDACVLYPQTLRDVLLSLARTELFRARWSADINNEWMRIRLAKHPEHTEKIAYTLERVNSSVPDCLVTGYEQLIDSITLPDPNDRHVVAAAIVGRADVIVTLNLTDFPDSALQSYHIEAQHPDEFILHQFSLDEGRALSAFKAMRGRWTRPSVTVDDFLATLERTRLSGTAFRLRNFADLI